MCVVHETHFQKFLGKEIKLLEIGVWQGGSLKMWKEYFGKGVTLIGVDINPSCKKLEEENIRIYIGDQSDSFFLNKLIEMENKFDIIIDDGGHIPFQQINSFKYLYPSLNDGGIYLCEDLHTNYWKEYQGGYKNPETFIEFSKNLIDELNAYYSQSPDLCVSDFTKNTNAIHIYDSVIVFDKCYRQKPKSLKIGKTII